jgi:hypothetical protein
MEYDAEPIQEKLTALGGLPLLVETYRALGLASSVNRNVSIKHPDRSETAGAAEEQRRKMRSCGWPALKSRTAAQCAETSTLRHTKKISAF